MAWFSKENETVEKDGERTGMVTSEALIGLRKSLSKLGAEDKIVLLFHDLVWSDETLKKLLEIVSLLVCEELSFKFGDSWDYIACYE